MFAASIVAYGVFVGVGNTFVPSLMNFGSIWGRATDTGGMACSHDGTTRRVACHVHRALFPGSNLPRETLGQ